MNFSSWRNDSTELEVPGAIHVWACICIIDAIAYSMFFNKKYPKQLCDYNAHTASTAMQCCAAPIKASADSEWWMRWW